MINDIIKRFHKDAYAPLSFDLGLNINKIHLKLPESYALWDKMASELADHISTFRIKELLKDMPVLHGDKENLPDEYLLRAAIIVSGFAHAYCYPDGYSEKDPLPDSVLIPIQEIAVRINKPGPNHTEQNPQLYVGRTFLEDVLGNWVFTSATENEQHVTLDKIQLNNLKPLMPYFNNQEEYIANLVTGPLMQAKFAPAIQHIADIEGELNKIAPNADIIIKHIKDMTNIIKNVRASFLFLSPKLGAHYVDQIIWPQTLATIGKKSHPNEMANNGADSPIFHIMDKLLNRTLYNSKIGKHIVERFNTVTIHYQELITEVGLVGAKLFDFVKQAHNEKLNDVFADLALAYAGPSGLLDAHRKKAYGYLKMSFLGGRLSTTGNAIGKANTTTNAATGLTTWGELNASFLKGMEERLEVLNRLGIDYQNKIQPKLAAAIDDLQMPRFKKYQVPAMNSDNKWVALYKDNVFDLTDLAKTHPGGHRILASLSGTDITTEFEQAHHFDRNKIDNYLREHHLGKIEEEQSSDVVDNWTMILFLITAVQNNIKNIWFFDKKEVNDRSRYMPFQFVMKTIDVLFGPDGYLDSLLNNIDAQLGNRYRERTLRFIKKTHAGIEQPIKIVELGNLVKELGLQEIKYRSLQTTSDTEINKLHVSKLYNQLVHECLQFLESLKIEITNQLDEFSDTNACSIEGNISENEQLKELVWTKVNEFIEKIDTPQALKQIELSNNSKKITLSKTDFFHNNEVDSTENTNRFSYTPS